MTAHDTTGAPPADASRDGGVASPGRSGPALLDVVRTRRALSGGNSEYALVDAPADLPVGSIGTVVEVFDDPARAYTVEFVDADGCTVGVHTVRDADVEPVEPGADRHSRRAWRRAVASTARTAITAAPRVTPPG